MPDGILFYGDSHGEWRPLLKACRDERPDAVFILGDCVLVDLGAVFSGKV
jgi:predicted phosphodiesterase